MQDDYRYLIGALKAVTSTASFPMSQFTIRHEGPVTKLIAEMSDLGSHPFRRIYPDAIDLGLTILSPTGQEVDFYISREDKDNEGELRYYELEPTPESLRKVPYAQNVKVILFND
jgi:hypothetical protein